MCSARRGYRGRQPQQRHQCGAGLSELLEYSVELELEPPCAPFSNSINIAHHSAALEAAAGMRLATWQKFVAQVWG
nr:MAG TPA: hypothetical protein [Caudoviricetes sp.]